MYLMQPYDDALEEILKDGIEKRDRTGVGCISVAGIQKKYKLNQGGYFPIVSKRRLYPKSVFAELLWVISGSTNNEDLKKLGCNFWSPWCDPNNPKYKALCEKYNYTIGDFGPIYGWQLRHFGADYLLYNRTIKANKKAKENGGIIYNGDLSYTTKSTQEGIEWCLSRGFDQLKYMVDILQNDPFGSNGRRCMFSLWNPKDLDKMALPPCHFTYQAIADGDGGLTGILTQRSCDMFCGVPANIQFYSALTIMLAQQANMVAREFIHNTNDSHIYLNHIDAVKEYLSRDKIDSPKLEIRKAKDIFSYSMDDFILTDYNPNNPIKVSVAV